MGFLRRLLGGDRGPAPSPDDSPEESELSRDGPGPADLDAEERARELELARYDQDRVGDLVRRQQRYADRSWTPPAQGGERRADDGESAQP